VFEGESKCTTHARYSYSPSLIQPPPRHPDWATAAILQPTCETAGHSDQQIPHLHPRHTPLASTPGCQEGALCRLLTASLPRLIAQRGRPQHRQRQNFRRPPRSHRYGFSSAITAPTDPWRWAVTVGKQSSAIRTRYTGLTSPAASQQRCGTANVRELCSAAIGDT
jgi:hypothetical protein